MIVSINAGQAQYTDRSGTIAAANTAQDVCAENMKRYGFFFQNVSDTDMWLNFGSNATADQPSIKVIAGALWEAPLNGVPVARVSVICSVLGKKFTAKEW